MALILASVDYFSELGFREHVLVEFALIFLVPVILLVLNKENLKDYGLQFGDVRGGLAYSVLLLMVASPMMFYGARLPSFKEYYPIVEVYSAWEFVRFELLVGVVMLSTEFFYRGFLLQILNRITPKYGNLLHSFVYMLVHYGKPGLEVPYSFVAGYAFGYVRMKTKSILPSFLMHYTSSIIFDLMVIYL